jgi:hypothetical protein
MTKDQARQLLFTIASKDVGQKEQSHNRAPWIAKYWPATSLPDLYSMGSSYRGRPPYCAAAVSYWVAQWLKIPGVLALLGMTPKQADVWRCKSPSAFGWLQWATSKRLTVLSDSPSNKLMVGDIMVFDMSHIGIVVSAPFNGTQILTTIEANTGPSGSRDGDGCWQKYRQRSLARGFIRLIS